VAAAERAGLPIALMAANFVPKVGELAQRHPNLKLIFDHLGRPSDVTSPSERWANLQDVLALAKYPTVAMKATGAPSYSDQPYPVRDIHAKGGHFAAFEQAAPFHRRKFFRTRR